MACRNPKEPAVTPEQFRQHGHQLIDLIADYRQTVAERPVMAQVEPGYLKAALPAPRRSRPNPSTPSSTTSTNW
jgi:aromatic-L-amino-acid decarboxylase